MALEYSVLVSVSCIWSGKGQDLQMMHEFCLGRVMLVGVGQLIVKSGVERGGASWLLPMLVRLGMGKVRTRMRCTGIDLGSVRLVW